MQGHNNIYMDHNATTIMRPSVANGVAALKGLALNASSIHSSGRKARGLIEAAREKIAVLANAGKAKVIFTSSGTESNNMALRGHEKYKILVSAIEHASILKIGVHENLIPVTDDGTIDITALQRILRQYSGEKVLISVMLANNETGVIQPIKKIAKIVHEHGGLIHTDAAQCFGKIEVDMQDLGVDMITISSHKVGGPHGVAALIMQKKVPIHSLIVGGGQEQGYRAGTENVAAIHGFGIAAEEAGKSIIAMKSIAILQKRIEEEIKHIAPDAIIFGEKASRLPNTSMIYMPKVPAETQLMHFDMAGIEVSAGSACSSGKIETSHVLLAMGVSLQIAKCAIRISLGVTNTMEDVEKFITSWRELYERTSSGDSD